ncbi:hypothetical protein M6D93_07620 [Jatrophihabitans telluris]|uniref:Uncharacterized protein n=1 Tax=Jatrophihabitans telluris TaxID=2038343 RepID=A0ABY4R1S2_9ACTN|nr:hypothetical protein [Jatrophihabitans telluris]UQX89861.1 hypothetical protein M6D93_07620 [Jatrophihabitans telluris]
MSAVKTRWLLLAVTAAVGGLLFGVLAAAGPRAALSFLGGEVIAVLLFEVSGFNIRYTERYLPNLTMVAAMFSYVMSAIALAVILLVSSPRVVDAQAIAIGLVAGVIVWVGTEVARTRVRSARP